MWASLLNGSGLLVSASLRRLARRHNPSAHRTAASRLRLGELGINTGVPHFKRQCGDTSCTCRQVWGLEYTTASLSDGGQTAEASMVMNQSKQPRGRQHINYISTLMGCSGQVLERISFPTITPSSSGQLANSGSTQWIFFLPLKVNSLQLLQPSCLHVSITPKVEGNK